MSWEVLTMKCRTSSSDLAILKKDLTRFAPVWLGLCAYLAIWAANLLTSEEIYNSYLYEPIAPVFAPVIAILLFSYLFDPKECFMIHSLPIRRERLFGIHILAGLVMFLVPTAFFCFVTKNIAGPSSMYRFLFTAAEFLLLFSIFTLCTMLTGRKIGAAALYLFVLALPAMLDLFLQDLYLPLLPGVYWNSDFYMLNPMMLVSRYADFQHESVLKSTDLLYLGGVLLVCLAILGISLVLYRKRKLECAGDLLSVSSLDPVFAVCAFFSGAAILTDSFSGPYFGAVIGYLAYWMLSKKTARVFTKRIILGLVGLLVFFTATGIVVARDPLGWVHYIPETAQIKTAGLLAGPRSADRLETSDPEVIAVIQELHADLVEDAINPDREYGGSQFHIVYELTNGKIIVRNYTCAIEDLKNRGSFLLSQPEAIFGTENPRMTHILIVHRFENQGPLNSALIDELSEIILKECRSGAMFDYRFDYSPWKLTIYCADNASPVDLMIPETAVETIAWLEANCTITE
ncbi:MAG: hypothetical protein IJY40_07940 [Oscillospiraceae bacterium]|nr:hypothetical protein [Oscillospiraceae bacterium]